MANRAIDDFDDVYYEGQYSAPQPEDREISKDEAVHAKMAPFASSIPVENYVYPPHNPMLGYDPATNTSMPMGLDPGGSFPYDLSTRPSSTLPMGYGLDKIASLQPQASRPGNISAYSTTQSGEYIPSMCWDQPHIPGVVTSSTQGTASQPLAANRNVGPSTGQASQTQQHQRVPRASVSGSHRFIQPKKLPGKSYTSAIAKSETTRKNTPYPNIYSGSGFDMMGILARVVSRHDPKIDLGPVDLSCAFVLCDLTLEDHPIVYVSNAFERLTGYTEREIVGKNCRFLQSPNAQVKRGEPRKFVDSYTVLRLRYAIEQLSELQVSIINYRKGGQPFMNLVTMIPVHWDSREYFVGFQVDLVERPDAVTKRNADGTYMIDYHRSQLPNCAMPSLDMYPDYRDPATKFSPSQVSVVLDSVVRGQPVARSHLHHILVENTGDVIFVLSYEGEFLYLSPSCRTMLEYKPSDLLGKTLSTVCHPSDIGPVTRDLRACTSDDPISVIYRIRRKYSGFTWFENHGGWHITEKGRQFMVLVGRIIPVYSSIQLADLQRGGLTENDLWAKLSLSGIILFMSSKSRAVLGRSPDDLMGKCIQGILGSDNLPQDSGIQQALESSRNDQQTTFTHQIRHRKGHTLTTQITLYPGDIPEDDSKPNFLIAHFRFPKPVQPSLSTTANQSRDQSRSQTPGDTGSGDTRQLQAAESTLHLKHHPNFPHLFTKSSATPVAPSSLVSEPSSAPAAATHLFGELNPTRGSSWCFELRELEKQNRGLAEEAQRLLSRRRKWKRKQSAAVIEKSCVMCQTKTTPEWRRGPSGNRDLCNSCGLRWAKQVRNAAELEKPVAVA